MKYLIMIIRGVFAALHRLSGKIREDLYLVLCLAVYAGLRRTELADFHVSALEFTDTLMIDMGDRLRFVAIPRWLYLRLVAYFDRTGATYLLPGPAAQRRRECDTAAAPLVRELGRVACLGALRGYCAAYYVSLVGAPTAARLLGRSNDGALERWPNLPADIRALWQTGPGHEPAERADDDAPSIPSLALEQAP